ncbi:MAG: 30S ribosomal protein S6 [Bacteroidota bacterium]
MQQYEVTFIVDPVLSKEEIGATAKAYEDQLKELGATIVNVDDIGLKQLAYPINKRTSGIYYCIEFQVEDRSAIATLELTYRRDARVLRFLTVKLDKYGVKYNEDRRAGKIGKSRPVKPAVEAETNKKDNRRGNRRGGNRSRNR